MQEAQRARSSRDFTRCYAGGSLPGWQPAVMSTLTATLPAQGWLQAQGSSFQGRAFLSETRLLCKALARCAGTAAPLLCYVLATDSGSDLTQSALSAFIFVKQNNAQLQSRGLDAWREHPRRYYFRGNLKFSGKNLFGTIPNFVTSPSRSLTNNVRLPLFLPNHLFLISVTSLKSEHSTLQAFQTKHSEIHQLNRYLIVLKPLPCDIRSRLAIGSCLPHWYQLGWRNLQDEADFELIPRATEIKQSQQGRILYQSVYGSVLNDSHHTYRPCRGQCKHRELSYK